MKPTIIHHGAVTGVTGSCHQYSLNNQTSYLIDCGLFQGAEADRPLNDFDFDPKTIDALIVTHCHIDHVGRIPWLIAAGYRGPIYCTEPTAQLLPIVLEDALGIHIPDDQALVERAIDRIRGQIQPLPYRQWHDLPGEAPVQLRFQPAGHILGSAYVELEHQYHRTVFSGDLGAPGAVFVDPPQPPERADILVLESTYGDRNHEHRATRQAELAKAIERSLEDGGTILIPAFSLGRTQELLAFLEELTVGAHSVRDLTTKAPSNSLSRWERAGERAALPIILDSPLAQTLTTTYRQLHHHWREPLQTKRTQGRYPLAFDNLITIENHRDHLKLVKRLAQTNQPAIVLAASGMCQGGRIVNYLQALLDKPETDILFVGYQARGTVGHKIQQARAGEVINVFNTPCQVNARIHRVSGFSAHADQSGLLAFATGMAEPPARIRLVHGDPYAKQTLKQHLDQNLHQTKTTIP